MAVTPRSWRLLLTKATVELQFGIGLAFAIPRGRGAVAITIVLGYLLALCGWRLNGSPRG